MKKILPFPWKKSPLPIFDSSGWYTSWYFEHRLEEELARAKRYGMTFTILYTLFEAGSPTAREQLQKVLGNLFEDSFRRSDLPAKLSANEFAVILPNTSADQAATVQERLLQRLAEFSPIIGAANYPSDAREDRDLLMQAAHQALASSPNPQRSNFLRQRTRRTKHEAA